MVEKVVVISGTFCETFELEDFPFDCQDLQLDILFKESDTNCKILPNTRKDAFVSIDLTTCTLSEWQIHSAIA